MLFLKLGMMSAVNFLMTKVGVTQKDIGKVTALDLRLVGCHIIQNLKVNVECFLSLGVHLLGKMIADLPTLLGVCSSPQIPVFETNYGLPIAGSH